MKLHKKLLTAAMVAALGGLYGCGGGDDTSITYNGGGNGGGTGSGGGGGSNVLSDCPDWALAKTQRDGKDLCQLPTSILVDRNLSKTKTWFIPGTVVVGNGNTPVTVDPTQLDPAFLSIGADTTVANVTLFIEPGTEIVGAQDSFANIIITRGSKIQAIGTAAEPIVFSSEDLDYDGSGEWGGLIIHGYASHNECPTAPGPCNIDSEGRSGRAGGYTDTDSSGELRYVVVAEAGFAFDTQGNEINGISFVGVGSGTKLNYIQVDNNADDGVEFYGGTVSGKYFVLTGNRDESLDWDEGWKGSLQHVLVVQEDAVFTEGHAIEADSEGDVSGGLYSTPVVANATFVGGGEQSQLFRLKESTGGFLLNVIGTYANNTGKDCIRIDDAGTLANINGRLDLNNNIYGCENFYDTTRQDATALNDGTVLLLDPQLDINYASQAPEAKNQPLDIAGFIAGNPSAESGDIDPNFFDPTTYIGAVDPDEAGTQWFEGWTLPGTF